MRRAFALLVLFLTACEGSFIRLEDPGRKVAINKSYEARDTCLKHKAADGMASADPAELASGRRARLPERNRPADHGRKPRRRQQGDGINPA